MKIKENAHEGNLKIDRIPMTCAEDDLKVPDPLQKNCFFYMIVGVPGSGKSNLVYSLISRKNFAYYRQFEYVVIFSASLHTLDKKLGLPQEQLIGGFDEAKLQKQLDIVKKQEHRALFIFDDVIASIKRGMPHFQKLIWNRRHQGKGISIMLVSQRLNAIPLEIRSASTGVFFFASKNNTELEILRKEFFGMKDPEFREILRNVFREKFDFLYLNLTAGEDKMIHRNFNLLEIERPDQEPLPEPMDQDKPSSGEKGASSSKSAPFEKPARQDPQ